MMTFDTLEDLYELIKYLDVTAYTKNCENFGAIGLIIMDKTEMKDRGLESKFKEKQGCLVDERHDILILSSYAKELSWMASMIFFHTNDKAMAAYRNDIRELFRISCFAAFTFGEIHSAKEQLLYILNMFIKFLGLRENNNTSDK